MCLRKVCGGKILLLTKQTKETIGQRDECGSHVSEAPPFGRGRAGNIQLMIQDGEILPLGVEFLYSAEWSQIVGWLRSMCEVHVHAQHVEM